MYKKTPSLSLLTILMVYYRKVFGSNNAEIIKSQFMEEL